MLRYKADRKTLFFALITTVCFALQWYLGEVVWPLYLFYLYLSVAVSVIAHNHNHLPIWKSDRMNLITEYWITIFYGFPTFAWIPTHNRNHHRHNNREEDYTKTYRFTEANNFFTFISYPSISGYFQQNALGQYLKEVKRKNPKKFKAAISQIIILVLWIAFWAILDWQKALLYVVIPQQVSLFMVLIFNYVQHVHADEESKYNHSRNFTGSLNFFLFNNGYHTVHHQNAALHWSLTPEAHAQIEHHIDDSLKVKSFWWFLFSTYILGAFIPSFRTRSMRLDRIKRQQQSVPANA